MEVCAQASDAQSSIGMTELDVEGNTMMINSLMQTNLRVLSNSTPSTPRIASTDQVRVELLRCPRDATVRWRMPEAKLGLMWVRDRRGSVRVLSSARPMETIGAGDANLWFFPEGFDAEGEVVGRSATDCVGLFVEPSFVPSPVKSELEEPIVGFSDSALGRTFNAFAGQLANLDEPQPMYLEGWALQVLAHIRRAGRVAEPQGPRRASGLAPWQLRRAKEMLMAGISEHLPLSAVAAACRLSVSHFARAFRVSTGVPPHQWLIAARVNTARDLLAQSETPLAEIANMCGFADQSHFSRLFAHVNGTSPGAWRRVHRAELSPAHAGARLP
jgi:AraC-like DNA-binding protein